MDIIHSDKEGYPPAYQCERCHDTFGDPDAIHLFMQINNGGCIECHRFTDEELKDEGRYFYDDLEAEYLDQED